MLQTTSGFALDLQLRFTGASYKDAGFTSNTALLVGFNFYYERLEPEPLLRRGALVARLGVFAVGRR